MAVLMVICLLLVLFIFIFVWTTYNRFILLRNRLKEAWSDVEVNLKRRHDLIPNLVEVVKGYAVHERETLDAVIKARNMAIETSKNAVEQQAKTENMMFMIQY